MAATWSLTRKPWWSTTSAWTAMSLRALTDGRALTNAGTDLGQITVWGQVDDSDEGCRPVPAHGLDTGMDDLDSWFGIRTIRTNYFDCFGSNSVRLGRSSGCLEFENSDVKTDVLTWTVLWIGRNVWNLRIPTWARTRSGPDDSDSDDLSVFGRVVFDVSSVFGR